MRASISTVESGTTRFGFNPSFSKNGVKASQPWKLKTFTRSLSFVFGSLTILRKTPWKTASKPEAQVLDLKPSQ